MNLLRLKSLSAVAFDHAIECGADPEEVEVSIQIELPGDLGAIFTSNEIDLYYDNDGQASGAVLNGFVVKCDKTTMGGGILKLFERPEPDQIRRGRFLNLFELNGSEKLLTIVLSKIRSVSSVDNIEEIELISHPGKRFFFSIFFDDGSVENAYFETMQDGERERARLVYAIENMGKETIAPLSMRIPG